MATWNLVACCRATSPRPPDRMFGDLPPAMRRRWALGRLAALLLVLWASREGVDWPALWALMLEHVSKK